MFASEVFWGYCINVNQTSQHLGTIDNVILTSEVENLPNSQ